VALRLTTLIYAALLVWSMPLRAQWAELHYVDPRLPWRTLETEHFLIHFAEQNRPQSRIVAAIAERVYLRTTALLDWRPRLRTHIVLMDSADFANGFASPVPFNLSGIFLSPPDEGELLQNRDWLELVLSHEFFHVVHLDKASGEPLQLRSVLGRLLFFFPNVLQPTWVVEGLAVYHESDPPRGYGRLYNSWFNGMMRAEVARGLRSLREVDAEGRGFPLNRDYLYGSYFFAFLRERYGDPVIRRFIDHYSSNVVPFRVQSNAAAVTGKEMDALWVDYHRWLRERFAPAEAMPLAGEALVRAFSLSNPELGADGTRWYVQADGYTRPKLMRQPPGGEPRIVRATESDTHLAAAGDGVLMAEQDICGNYNLLYNLYFVDAGGARRTISQCDRHRFAAEMSAGRIAAVRVDGGAAEVVVLENSKPVRSLYRTGAGESVSGIAASGEHVVITAVKAGVWTLLDVTDGAPTVLVADEAVKHSPRFGRTPDEVFFVGDYDKRYDVWSWERSSSSLARWTRAPYGVREISGPVAGELLLTTIEADGVTLRRYPLPAQPLERRSLQAAQAAPPLAPAEMLAGEERPYSAWPSIKPTAWVPLLQLADGAIALGAAVSGMDALGVHQYLLAPMVEITQGELLGRAEYAYDGRHGVVLNRDMIVRASEADGSRPKIKAYSIKQNGQWVSLWRSLALNRRWYWGLGAAIDEETFHDLTLGSTSVRNERVAGLLAGLDTRRQQFLSEGPSEGQELRLFAETSRGLGAAFSGNAYRADWRGDLPLGKTVLALRWNEAYGQRDAQPFELGGSESDEVILLPILNQRTFALRGYTTGTPELTGHRARLTSFEWRAPLADIDRHFMVPPVGMNRVALNLFADVGAAWEHGGTPHYHRGVGAELISEPRFGYIYGTTLRAGIAKGLDRTGSTKIYLRVGRAF
jgi:hypothetical protein